MQVLRRIIQMAVVVAVLYLALGWGTKSFENFCPFGGIESLYSLATSQFITCAISPWNFAVFFAVLGLTIASKKSFCGWICPIGFLYEMLGQVQVRLFGGRLVPSVSVDRWIRPLRWGVLVVVLYFTWNTGELVFRGYDPYYLLFSGMGHGTLGTASIFIIVGLLISGLIIKMSWCRYLCPMSAVMDGFSAPSVLAIKRNSDICTGCQACNDGCHLDLQPPSTKSLLIGIAQTA